MLIRHFIECPIHLAAETEMICLHLRSPASKVPVGAWKITGGGRGNLTPIARWERDQVLIALPIETSLP